MIGQKYHWDWRIMEYQFNDLLDGYGSGDDDIISCATGEIFVKPTTSSSSATSNFGGGGHQRRGSSSSSPFSCDIDPNGYRIYNISDINRRRLMRDP